MRELLIRLIDALMGAQGEGASPMASLERSIAAAGRAHITARRALAVAMAEESREAKRRADLVVKVDDLERRAVGALRAGREDLAVEASEAIAAIATEINASERASQRFAAEVVLARREVDAQRRRLADLGSCGEGVLEGHRCHPLQLMDQPRGPGQPRWRQVLRASEPVGLQAGACT